MKALSIQQPWAWLVVNGWKPIENRTWATSYRGSLLIHAGMKIDDEGYRFIYDHCRHLIGSVPGVRAVPRGGIVGHARLVDCVQGGRFLAADCVPWFFGPYGFVLREAKPMPFRPLRGQLGLFEVPDA